MGKSSPGTDGRLFAWGDVWLTTTSPTTTALSYGQVTQGGQAVGTSVLPYGLSPYQVREMVNTEAEWTGSDYGLYPGSHLTGTQVGSERPVLRGG